VAENYFGENVAARYDETLGEWGDPEVVESAVECLAALAGDGAALELGIGTGRIALPLVARGVRVQGIDLSEAMVARLRAKPGGDEIAVAIGNFATTGVDGVFSLAYVVFNTIMNLRTQDAQVACFENVGAHLESGGCFVVEIMLPELQRLPLGARFLAFDVSAEHLGFDEYDLVQQRLTSHHYYPAPSTPIRRSPAATRGRPSSTSWHSWRGCGCASAGATGTARLSQPRARSTSPSGRRRRASRWRASARIAQPETDCPAPVCGNVPQLRRSGMAGGGRPPGCRRS